MNPAAPPTPLAASGSYFGRPIAAFDPASRWSYRHYNTVAIILIIVAAIAFVVFTVIAITGPDLASGIYFPVFSLGLVLFFFRLSYNVYEIDERGFTTRGPFWWRVVTIAPRDVARVGVSSTGPSLIGDFASLDETGRAKREQVMAAVAKSYKTDLFADSAIGFVLVVETRAVNVTGVYIKQTDAAALLAAASTLEPRTPRLPV
ncbi:hypothetical protein EYE40_04015 [Glaciihabitans arcticus]|uniref:PH domain-containing protein n=1 Tax=Glaciihabitans arcticus TaxID=2668039 RepID=A0A4V2JES5_9MICO|nr:hypothetical protein [Glaciihabitans arcticus]TBN56629.1 hypothetical protein EYE40_04015 [Glaciihabitans arcticus]